MREIIIEVPDKFGKTLKPEKANTEIKGELVRCKDCKHWIPGKITDKDDFISPRCKRNGGGWSADEFCSNAERR